MNSIVVYSTTKSLRKVRLVFIRKELLECKIKWNYYRNIIHSIVDYWGSISHTLGLNRELDDRRIVSHGDHEAERFVPLHRRMGGHGHVARRYPWSVETSLWDQIGFDSQTIFNWKSSIKDIIMTFGMCFCCCPFGEPEGSHNDFQRQMRLSNQYGLMVWINWLNSKLKLLINCNQQWRN